MSSDQSMQFSGIQNLRTVKKGLRPSCINQSLGSRSKFSIFDRNSPCKNKLDSGFKDDQIARQILQQIQSINQCIHEYHFFQFSGNNKRRKSIKEELCQIDDQIYIKDVDIKQTQEEIKFLKNIKVIGKKSLDKYEESPKKKGQKRFTLAEQLREQRQCLQTIQALHFRRREDLNHVKKAVFAVEQQYFEECQKTKERPISYQQFKQLNDQKKKQLEFQVRKAKLNNQHIKRSSQKKIQQGGDQTKFSKMTLKQLQNKKHITQQALKNSKRKHSHQINEFMAKIQFLRDQEATIQQKIKEKQEEMCHLQAKFHAQKIPHYLSPTKRRDKVSRSSSQKRNIYGY